MARDAKSNSSVPRRMVIPNGATLYFLPTLFEESMTRQLPSRNKTIYPPVVVLSLIVVLAAPAVSRADQTWINASPGNIGTASNWSGNAVPNAADTVAIISTQPTNAGDFTLNVGITVGTLLYSNSQYREINGIGSINFDTTGGNAVYETTGSGALWIEIPSVVLATTTEFRINNAASVYISSVMSGSGGLIKTDTGILTLSGSNSYSGPNTISGGLLGGNTIADAGINSSFGRGNFAISNGSVLEYTGASALTNRTISLTNGGIIEVTGGATLTLNGVVSGTGGFSSEGAGGTLLTNANNTYAGSTFIGPSAELRIGASERIPDSSAVTVEGTLNLNNFNETIGALSGSGSVTNVGILLTGGDNTSTTFSGTISGSSLRKTGTGTMTLSGTSSYSGGTNIFGGSLSGNSIANIGSNSAFGTGNFALVNNATMEYTGPDASTNRNIAVDVTGGTVSVSSNGSLTVSGVLDTGPLTKAGAGVLTLTNAANSYSSLAITGGTLSGNSIAAQGTNSAFGQGNFAISNGATLQYTGGNAGTNRSISLGTGGGTLDISSTLDISNGLTVSGVISGAGSLSKTGSSYLALSGANTYSGGTIINGGDLVAINNTGMPQVPVTSLSTQGHYGWATFRPSAQSLAISQTTARSNSLKGVTFNTTGKYPAAGKSKWIAISRLAILRPLR